jgi:hypothetical protein
MICNASPRRMAPTGEPWSLRWEIIADNLSKAGWSWGCVSAIDSKGQTIWIADAYRDDGKRFVVRADEKLTTFLELESTDSIRQHSLNSPACPCVSIILSLLCGWQKRQNLPA